MIYEMTKFNIHDYDRYIVSFSGGKDSTATFLYLLDQGIPKDKIELWHQEIDGRERNFFDWEVTPDYCRRFAQAFGVQIYFQWKEAQVWAIIRRYRVRVHPCYYMGWGRCSCRFCIFGNKNQFASAAVISPERLHEIATLEKQFGCTIKRKCDIMTLVDSGTPYRHITEALKTIATSYNYELPVILPDNEEWILPSGAFGEQCGPM